MSELSRADFAKGVNDAIRALRAVYSGVRTMLGELADALEAEPSPLYDLGVRARPIASRLTPDEKILRTWEGRFFVEDVPEADDDTDDEEGADDEDADDEPRGKKHVTLSAGQRLAFVKVILYHPGSNEGEPHLLYGVLDTCRVAAAWPTLKLPKGRLRRVLDVVRSEMKVGPVETKASVFVPPDVPKKGKGKKSRGNHLTFDLTQPPASFPLFDVRGPDQVREIAAALKRQWAGLGAPGSPTNR